MNFSEVLFRASSVGNLMTEAKTKEDKASGKLSETTKTYLVDIYVSNKYGRNNEFTNKFVEKGLMVEEDSITLYSRIKKEFFKKNEEPLSNSFIKGTPDLYIGEIISKAETIIDIKSSWDIYSFFRTISKPINKTYYWQMQAYMALTGAKKAILAYCLIDTPEVLISDEKRRMMYKMGVATDVNELYIEACKLIEFNMKYDDIPLKNRCLEYVIERNDEDIELMYSKITKAREFLQELDVKLNQL